MITLVLSLPLFKDYCLGAEERGVDTVTEWNKAIR